MLRLRWIIILSFAGEVHSAVPAISTARVKSYDMGSGQGSRSVFDGLKFLPATPEALMAEINTTISALEYAHATVLLNPSSSSLSKNKNCERKATVYDAHIAEEAYRLGCLALAEGRVDEALHSFNISLSKCPRDNIDALDKIQSLISITSRQLQKSYR
ncbi:hypothetical protein Nepgr_005886 [Nepenthes gracilis]|uniref:Uncharacterized protein n=1 Tax=Nepenthes gracilis TaxID=150966 RepID=A0AAD3XGV5_NEPGR|nr:hypothetical protein Nepgr_005886 [Nepenthes gracilis]